MAARQPVLVLISEDPRVSHRANEAMRIALGVVAGENPVRIVLTGPAVHLLDDDTDDLVDGDDIAKFRAALKKLGIPFHVEATAVPSGAGWNAEGHPLIPSTAAEIAALARPAPPASSCSDGPLPAPSQARSRRRSPRPWWRPIAGRPEAPGDRRPARGAGRPRAPGVAVRRLGEAISTTALLDLIFESDHVVTW